MTIPDYVRNAGSFINWVQKTLEPLKRIYDLGDIQRLIAKAEEYGLKVTASLNDLRGHPGTEWPIPHIHIIGKSARLHIAFAEEALDWLLEYFGLK